MAVSPDFLAHITDQLTGFGPVAVRRLFGGAGLFRAGRMFGLVAADVLYFKVGDGNRAAYDAAGAKPFTYQRLSATAALTSYREVPADVLDDPDLLADWARAAWAAAQIAMPTERRKRGFARR
jgi:DNA transformation protein and related proteins